MNPLPEQLLLDIQTIVGEIQTITIISGGITNQNYKLETASAAFMLRIPGQYTELLGIDRQAEFACSSIAYNVGIGAEPIAYLERHNAILTRFLEQAETLTAQQAKTQLEAVVQALKTIHGAPAFPKSFSAFETTRQYHQLALEKNVVFPTDTRYLLEHLTQIEQILDSHAMITSCHNDLLPANLLLTNQLWIVDWEYAGNGNLFFDLGNLAANLELTDSELETLTKLYFGKTNAKLHAQIQLMRLVSDAREAFWGFLQSGISSLEFDFTHYAQTHFERLRKGLARDEYAAWLEILC